jgi:hypothetical protein
MQKAEGGKRKAGGGDTGATETLPLTRPDNPGLPLPKAEGSDLFGVAGLGTDESAPFRKSGQGTVVM